MNCNFPPYTGLFKLSTDSEDTQLLNSISAENIDIAGAPVNVYMLLGNIARGKLVDLSGKGTAISNGSMPNYPALEAFTKYNTRWRSIQTGTNVIQSSFLGYDFGVSKLNNGRVRWSNDSPILHNISTISIKQSNNPNHRITSARVERSMDGNTWYGVCLIQLPNDNNLNTINFAPSVPSRYWRIRPTSFTGGDTDFWEVYALQLSNYVDTQLGDIEDVIFMENRNRDYNTTPITLSGFYQLIQQPIDLSKFGLMMQNQTYAIKLNFSSTISQLARPIIIGDIIELPSEAQYDLQMNPVKKYLQVTDTFWSNEGYTPGWTPLIIEIHAEPLLASQESNQIFNSLDTNTVDSNNVLTNTGQDTNYQDLSDISNSIRSKSIEIMPERGEDAEQELAYIPQQIVNSYASSGLNVDVLNYLPTPTLYVEDGMPPNGKPFTEGNEFPQSPTDGDFHRLTYTHVDEFIPVRLYRFSSKKNQWIYMATDRRQEMNKDKPLLQEFLNGNNKFTPEQLDNSPRNIKT